MIETPADQPLEAGFSILHQKVELDIDLLSRSLKGRTEITLNPHSKELRKIGLSCRQCDIKRVFINGKICSTYTYDDPYTEATLPWEAGVEQWHMLKSKVEGALRDKPEEELVVNLPRHFRIEEQNPFTAPKPPDVTSRRDSTMPLDLDTPQMGRGFVEQSARFTPITISVEYVIAEIRDGMHFVGWEEGDLRYPHAYSQNRLSPGSACCLYPCVDSLASRCTWEVSIKCSKTLGDALKERQAAKMRAHTSGINGTSNRVNGHHGGAVPEYDVSDFSEEDKALDLAVVCTGEMTDEVGSSDAQSLHLLIPRRSQIL